MTVHTWKKKRMLNFRITVKRISVIYIINFLLPIFFLLCLDLFSFLLSDTGGEKVGFKITILLAVTVMQLILNDLLPSSSEMIPIIVVYCIGIFTMMMLSLLETLFVMYLIEKDSSLQEEKAVQDKIPAMKKYNPSSSDVTAFRRPSAAKEDTGIIQMEGQLALDKLTDELREMKKMITLLNSDRCEEKSGYWTKLAGRINKIFGVCYVICTAAFLATIFLNWTSEEE
ncbi:PREDICTED: 5-hydroxytryptamine receptor 3A-like [Cyprinodon variegatus]|uniref:5-hydroxytryptamine receptor 3A-like n=1 Tax=Cyprinodon variegatus TaxID=28743 RepID=UPI00074298C8|nr:PREDICTED: 5-hydroxytryptamine receptor 3A-like [Cyprinodon variegatus]